jgi:hypothetical protein
MVVATEGRNARRHAYLSDIASSALSVRFALPLRAVRPATRWLLLIYASACSQARLSLSAWLGGGARLWLLVRQTNRMTAALSIAHALLSLSAAAKAGGGRRTAARCDGEE